MDIKNDKITYPTSEDIYTQTILEQMTNVFTGYLSKNINNFVIKVQKQDFGGKDKSNGKSLLVIRSTIPNYHLELIPALMQVLTSITHKGILCLIKRLDMNKINALKRHLNTLVYEASRYRRRYMTNSGNSGDPYLDGNINALKHMLELLAEPIVLKVSTITKHKVDSRSDFIIENGMVIVDDDNSDGNDGNGNSDDGNDDDNNNNDSDYNNSNNNSISSSGVFGISNINSNNNIVTLIPNSLYSIAIMIIVEGNSNQKKEVKHIIENTHFFVCKEVNINNKELEKKVDIFIRKGKFPFKPILMKRRYPLLIDMRLLISLYRAMLLSMNTLSVEFIDKNGSSIYNIDREYTFMNYLT